MLKLEHISKTYRIGDIETKALEDISVSFREKEFVAILGASGSGKTTCLNIIGGLDRYDSGELAIKGKSTKLFKDKDWDAYRNNSIGFVFQSYNLIGHISIVANVEMSLTLSGVSSAEKRRRSLEVLEKVGLKDHLHKKPSQLSGGQMQRVAIARALVNNPEILLCDEPTGALDTVTSVQIMDLIKEIATDRLVIMVTHNPELAEQYADRIIKFQDGNIISDTNPYEETQTLDDFKLKKTSMSFFTALRLSFNNIRTKKGRTFLTSFASSIGIIGIAVILSLSNGFQLQIDAFQRDAMDEFPIVVMQRSMNMNSSTRASLRDKAQEYPDTKEVKLYDPAETFTHKNDLSDEFMTYIEDIDPQICSNIGYGRLVAMNMLTKRSGEVKPVSLSGGFSSSAQSSGGMMSVSSMNGMGFSSYPVSLGDEVSYIEKNYDCLEGSFPKSKTDLVLVVDQRNRITVSTMNGLGFETDEIDSIKFSDIIGTEFKVVMNNEYYTKTEMGTFMPGTDYDKMYTSGKCITLKVTGVIRQKESNDLNILSAGIAYSDELTQTVLDNALQSDIVKAQNTPEEDGSYLSVFTKQKMTAEELDMQKMYIGATTTPFMVMVYPKSFEAKDQVIEYLDSYNSKKEIFYTTFGSVKEDKREELIKNIGGDTGDFAALVCLDDETRLGEINKFIEEYNEAHESDDKKIFTKTVSESVIQNNEITDFDSVTAEEGTTSAENGKKSYLMVTSKDESARKAVVRFIDGTRLDYLDLAETLSEMTGGIMNGITLVLIAFASISLIVSLIMICIITYTSVLERIKEIGILKALGARKKDIARVFDAETCILGVFSGVLGIAISYSLIYVINIIIFNITELENVAQLNILYALGLIVLSTVLTMLGGHIPAWIASRKDAVEALRSE